ncbi:MAG: PAS domain S-box protein [Rhodospirillaceae bacterium]
MAEIETHPHHSNTFLQESLARAQAAIEATTDAIISIDKNGLIEAANRATEQLFGYATDELVGENVSILMPEPHRSQHDSYIKHYLKSGTPRVIGIGRELSGQKKDGTIFPMRLSVGESEANGRPIFSGIIHDITKRKEAETRRDLLGRIVEQSLNEIYVFDANTLLFVDVNKGARENLGYSIKELISMSPLHIKPEYTEHAFRQLIKPITQGTEKSIVFETIHKRKDGSTYDVEVHMQDVNGSRPKLIAAILIDITERNALHAQLRQVKKMETLGQLTGGVAHDFNNILAAIMGSLEIIEDETPENSTAREFLKEALDATQMGADLTRRLLAFARHQPLEPTTLSLNALLRDIQTIIRRTLGGNIGVEFRLKPDIGLVTIDAVEFENAVLNLAVNARDAMPDGGQLMIETDDADLDSNYIATLGDVSPGKYVRVRVSDTGHGMTPEIVDRAFEPFFTTKLKEDGTGLGLSTVYGFVKQSGGHIVIYSEPDFGTVVTLYLPVTERHQEDTSPPAQTVPMNSGTGTVLVVDDNARVRRIAAHQIESLGYSVIEASSGENALEVFNSGQAIDLVFTDVLMPKGKSGPELANQLLELGYTGKILFTSGFTEDAIKSAELATGEIPLLQKPYSKRDLADALHTALES